MLLSSIGASPSPSWTEAHSVSGIVSIIDFLHADIGKTSTPVLDPTILMLPCFHFGQTTLLQIDEIVNISVQQRERLLFSAKEGTLKVLLSDGFSNVVGITKDVIEELKPSLVPGVKIMLRKGVEMRFGVVFLRKGQVEILGGRSTILSERRMKMVVHDPAKRREQDAKKVERRSTTSSCPTRTAASTPKIVPLALVAEKKERDVFLSSDSDEIDIDEDILNECERAEGPIEKTNTTDPAVDARQSVYFQEKKVMSFAEFKRLSGKEGVYDVRCRICDNENLAIVKRAGTLCFTLKVRICDPDNVSDACMATVSSNIIGNILDTDPPTWMMMEEDEQASKWTSLISELRHAGPTITLDVSRQNHFLRTSITSLHAN